MPKPGQHVTVICANRPVAAGSGHVFNVQAHTPPLQTFPTQPYVHCCRPIAVVPAQLVHGATTCTPALQPYAKQTPKPPLQTSSTQKYVHCFRPIAEVPAQLCILQATARPPAAIRQSTRLPACTCQGRICLECALCTGVPARCDDCCSGWGHRQSPQ